MGSFDLITGLYDFFDEITQGFQGVLTTIGEWLSDTVVGSTEGSVSGSSEIIGSGGTEETPEN